MGAVEVAAAGGNGDLLTESGCARGILIKLSSIGLRIFWFELGSLMTFGATVVHLLEVYLRSSSENRSCISA